MHAEIAGAGFAGLAAGMRIEADVFHCGRRSVVVRDPDQTLVRLYADEGAEPSAAEVNPDLALFVL